MKQDNPPEHNAISFLIFYILAGLIVFGIIYAIISDVRDLAGITLWNTLSPLGEDLNDNESTWGFDVLNLLLSMSITFFVIAMAWYAKQMAQKPEQPY